MKPVVPAAPLLVSAFALALAAVAMAEDKVKPPATYPELPSEIPAKFKPVTSSYDYTRRKVMIPMRDGVKLHTVILIPKGAKGAAMLLTRTPYSADRLTSHADSAHLGPVLNGYDNALEVILEGGYIRVVQDVRGKHGSEGDYVVNRPLRGPLNKTPVDHATDTYDTIDWLVKNVPESNGKVGIIGISYDDIARAWKRQTLDCRSTPALPLRPSHGEPRLPAGPPDHGADPVELVPALRPQSPDVRTQYLLGQAGRLSKGHAADLSRT